MRQRGLRVAGAIVLAVLGAAGLVLILTNGERDRAGAVVVGGLFVGARHLHRTSRG